jgi:FkbM family methyltransferase
VTTLATDPLIEILRPERLTAVVDIGANPIESDPPYKTMLQRRLCRVIGFEPQPDALAALQARKSDLETYLPYIIGDGSPSKLRICNASGMTSLFEPDANTLYHFRGFSEMGRVVRTIPVETHRLDDVAAISAIDFLKMDVQGGELAAIQSGGRLLSDAVAVQAEVSFIPLYHDQPVFGQIDIALRQLGFVPHTFPEMRYKTFPEMRYKMISPLFDPENPGAAYKQLLEADIVYVRNFMRADAMTAEQLKHLALIAHNCYRSFDLAMNCIHHLEKRRAVAVGSAGKYFSLLPVGTSSRS